MFTRLMTTLAFALLAFAPIAAAKEFVQFYSPPSDITKQYIVKESSRFYIQWQTELPRVELVAFHGPNASGISQVLVLASNLSSDVTSWPWTATALANYDLKWPLHFRVNTQGNTSEGTNSADIYLSPAGNIYTPVSIGATTSQTSASTSSPPSATTTSASTSTSTSAPVATDSSQYREIAVGLGVGLGLGIPLLLLAGVMAARVWFQRQRRSRIAEDPAAAPMKADWSPVPTGPVWERPYVNATPPGAVEMTTERMVQEVEGVSERPQPSYEMWSPRR